MKKYILVLAVGLLGTAAVTATVLSNKDTKKKETVKEKKVEKKKKCERKASCFFM